MPYSETKVYFDGSHYIAIPHTERPSLKRKNREETELIEVPDNVENMTIQEDDTIEESTNQDDTCTVSEPPTENKHKKVTVMTKKDFFEKLYKETDTRRKKERREIIIKEMRPYFKDKEATEQYVDTQLARKLRNLICRRIRLTRKVHLQEFNYFCTFTYDDAKHTEDSFKKKLQGCFKMMCHRKHWKYVGVWERSPEKNRLHFHGLFYIPDGAMPGSMITVNDYNFNTQKRQITYQNTYFNERFGRSDFKVIDTNSDLGDAIAYLIKYIEKTNEKIVYSKGLPQYFISDIMEKDVICNIGLEDNKLLLADNFECWDEGCYMGQVSKEVIAQMRKAP